MRTSDFITSSQYMAQTNILQSLSKTTGRPAIVLFYDIARRSAKLTSRSVGRRVVFSDESLIIFDDTLPADAVLDRFQANFLAIARAAVGV